MTKTTVLGLGAMGSRMARNLLEAGHPVTVYNRSAGAADALEAQGARRAGTPREAAEGAEVVISMLTDDDASRALWLEGPDAAQHGLATGTLAIESSTLTPGWVQELAGKIAATGAHFLEAPVIGSRPQAEAGQLVYLLGGEADDVARAEPVLRHLGAAIHHVGSVGQAATLKLVVNALLGIQVAAMAELLGLLRRSGSDLSQAADILGSLPVLSLALKGATALMLARNFAPQFPIELVEKDFRYAQEAAQRVGAALPLTEAVQQVFGRALAQGHGAENIGAVMQLYLKGSTH